MRPLALVPVVALPGAQRLAELGKWRFQQWPLSLIDARPRTEGEGKGADRGVDGMLYFYESKDKLEKIIVQVKGGGVKRGDVATLLAKAPLSRIVQVVSVEIRSRLSNPVLVSHRICRSATRPLLIPAGAPTVKRPFSR